MNATDLNKVTSLIKTYNNHKDKYEDLRRMLMNQDSEYYNIVRIQIGGDKYGNGLYTTIEMPLRDCKNAIDKLEADKQWNWSKMVSIKMTLDELGVKI